MAKIYTQIKQRKKPSTIYKNLNMINIAFKNGFSEEDIYKVANSRLGWYKRCAMGGTIAFAISLPYFKIKHFLNG